MRNKRILFNSWSGAFFQKGGGEIQLLETKKVLEKRGYVVDFFNMWSPQEGFDILHQFSIEAGVEHVVKKYKSMGFKVALSTIMWTPPNHGTFEFDRIKSIIDSSDVLLTNSNLESKILSNHFDVKIDKFFKTRNAISKDYFTRIKGEVFRKKYGVTGEFILSVANIDRRKNIDVLAEACQEVGIQLISIGHIKDEVYFNSFKNKFLNFRHLGPIESSDILKSAYSECLVFALPSLCETPGIAALEAASQGATILITKEGCAEEYFVDYAEYVDPYNIQSIIAGIKSIQKQNESKKVPDSIVSEWSWELTGDEVEVAYAYMFR